DRTRASGAQIQGKVKAVLFGSPLQALEAAPRLHGCGAANGIDLLNGRHVLERQDEVHTRRSISIADTGEPAVHDHALPARVTELHDPAHLLGGARARQGSSYERSGVPMIARARTEG